MDAGDYLVAHRVEVTDGPLITRTLFSMLYSDPIVAGEVESYIKKVIDLADVRDKFKVLRSEVIIHKKANMETVKDLLEDYVLG